MEPAFFSFRIEDEQSSDQSKANAPSFVVLDDKPEVGKKTVLIEDGALKGAGIIYDKTLLQELGFEPEFGPSDEVPPAPGAGVPLNLQPPAVFPEPVTLLIPCPGQKDVSGVPIYYWDGQEWLLGCDGAGNVTPDGEGWLVPGSRVNHNGDSAFIEIKVYHFSAVAVAAPSGTALKGEADATPGTALKGEADGGGGAGCFISTLWN